MKKLAFFLLFGLFAIAANAQMSKADASAFLSRNPVGNCANVTVYNTIAVNSDNHTLHTTSAYDKTTIVSLTAMESGFSLIVNQNGVNREKFFPYGAIQYMMVAGDNSMIISLRQ